MMGEDDWQLTLSECLIILAEFYETYERES